MSDEDAGSIIQEPLRLQALVDAEPARFVETSRLRQHLEALAGYEPLAERIESFWLLPANQKANTWTEHVDINAVMLATSLGPAGYLGVQH